MGLALGRWQQVLVEALAKHKAVGVRALRTRGDRVGTAAGESARQAVEVLRQNEDAELSLMGVVDAAVVRLIVEMETRYPELR